MNQGEENCVATIGTTGLNDESCEEELTFICKGYPLNKGID